MTPPRPCDGARERGQRAERHPIGPRAGAEVSSQARWSGICGGRSPVATRDAPRAGAGALSGNGADTAMRACQARVAGWIHPGGILKTLACEATSSATLPVRGTLPARILRGFPASHALSNVRRGRLFWRIPCESFESRARYQTRKPGPYQGSRFASSLVLRLGNEKIREP